jgi:hypothetical protein
MKKHIIIKGLLVFLTIVNSLLWTLNFLHYYIELKDLLYKSLVSNFMLWILFEFIIGIILLIIWDIYFKKN